VSPPSPLKLPKNKFTVIILKTSVEAGNEIGKVLSNQHLSLLDMYSYEYSEIPIPLKTLFFIGISGYSRKVGDSIYLFL